MKYFINNKCNLCDICPVLCPANCIYMGVEHYVIDADSCIGCAICEDVCPEHAVHVLHPEEAEAEKAAAHAAAKAELDAQHKKGDPGVAAPPGQEGGKNFFGKKPKPKP